MKIFATVIAFVVFSSFILKGQIETDKELYPEKYTYEKAKEFEQKGEYDKAVWIYINLFPDDKYRVAELVKAAIAKTDTADVLWYIKRSFALYGTFDPAILSFKKGSAQMDADILIKKGAWGDELIAYCVEPDQVLTTATEYNFRSMKKFNEKDMKGALDDLNKSIEIEPKGQYYFNRAYTKSIMEDCKGAIEDFNKTIELGYRLAEAYFERGYCREHTDDIEGAFNDYTSAIKEYKDYADAYNNRGLIYYKQKKFKEAKKDLDKAVKSDPKHIGAFLNRGYTKYGLGDNKGACADWQKAVDLGYTEARTILEKYCK